MAASHALPPGGHRLLGEALEAVAAFERAGAEPGAPWAPQRFTWRGREHEVVAGRQVGRRMGAALESLGMAPYVRGHRVLLTTREGLVLLVEGLRGGRAGGRWRALRLWEAPPGGAPEGPTTPTGP